jgi:pimeloyl-ACP methyl ester carboxylesterase
MIHIVAVAGYRVIAPDLVGFGRSDKPTRREDYTYQRHVDWMRSLLLALDLRRITLVGQDWGGFIELRLATELEERFARIVAANTFLPTGDTPPGEGLLNWQRFSQQTSVFRASEIIQSASVNAMPHEVGAAYDAPFPDERYQVGARQFPLLIPTSPNDPATPANRAAWQVLRHWEKPFLMATRAISSSRKKGRSSPRLSSIFWPAQHRERCSVFFCPRGKEITSSVRRMRGEGMEKGHAQHEVYRIVVKGHVDHTWSDWFDGLTIRQTDTGETMLSGPLADQSALHGVLIKVRDLGLPLLSLTLIEPGKPDTLT